MSSSSQFQVQLCNFQLMLNLPIPIFLEDGRSVRIRMPNIKDYHSNDCFSRIGRIFSQDISNVKDSPETYGFIAENHYELLMGLYQVHVVDAELTEAFSSIGITPSATGVLVEGYPITHKDFEEIRIAYLVATENLNLEEVVVKEETEMERKMREMEERIKKAKSEGENQETVSLDEALELIIHELHISISEIKELNQYGFIRMYQIATKANTDDIYKILAGTGHLSEKDKYKNIIQ